MIKPGTYRHYRGDEYKVIGVGKYEETEEEMVIYRALYGDHQIWIRPLSVFTEEVEIDGETIPRFTYIGE